MAHIASGNLEIRAELSPEFAEILTDGACAFLVQLSERFEDERQRRLAARKDRQQQIRAGVFPDFLKETESVRESTWTVAPIPKDLLDRRVEITGPPERKMLINALNSGASVYMSDFEDSNAPTWQNLIEGQINLRDAIRRTISYQAPGGKSYALNAKTATLFVRPRGWHLDEKHALVNGRRMSASLFDFGLFFYHNAAKLLEQGSGPYFYLPKMESHLEARLWNDVFLFSEDAIGVPRGSIRATVLIETILAAFEMDEILYELREHSAGLNCGRWDYIFSFIKKFGDQAGFVLPDRASVTMDKHFLKSYVELLIATCHRRGIHAMGGMAAQIPIKNDPEANERALEKVRQDKLREVKAGHDGTWVAHPGLAPIAKEIFDQYMPTPNQIAVQRTAPAITAADLLKVPEGEITEAGLRMNIDIGIRYLESWLRSNGCVPIYNLMEDAATAEISRAQVWQWIRHGVRTGEGTVITATVVCGAIASELDKVRQELGPAFSAGKFELAGKLFEELVTGAEFPEFLTLAAYEQID